MSATTQPLTTTANRNSTVAGQIHSRYSWLPLLTPRSSARIPISAAALNDHSASHASLGRRIVTPPERAATYIAHPTSAINAQPKNVPVV